ncbi:hypothetical protein ACFWTE_07490 [Nocardiopsis sp. NPDC058631]|uniref:hypothetical protein n=1 Tax=Nocardiopsis sp. NPDC058631 TaxID=3346566 RepID=UPI00365936FC
MSTQIRTNGAEHGSAWVESPLQLLSVTEARSAGLLFDDGQILLRPGVRGLAETAAELRRLFPHGTAPTSPARVPEAPANAAGVWAVGDAFSGRVQRALLSAPRCRIVIVDDGLATWHLIRLLSSAGPRPLLRARVCADPVRAALGTAAALRLRRDARQGRLTVFTMLPVSAALRARAEAAGVHVVRHGFGMLRSLPGQGTPSEHRIVLGTALVADGLVHRATYLSWLAAQSVSGPLAYYPHRREDPEVLTFLDCHPRIRVVEPGIPVELSLRGLGPEHTVLAPPSTALVSLRTLVRGASVRAVGVPEHWWTRRARPGLRADLSASATPDAKETDLGH